MATEELDTKGTCPRCRGGPETYWYLHEMYVFDVDRAREFAADGREPVEVDDESVRESIETGNIDECHIPHVDPSIPGLIAHVRYQEGPGKEILKGHLLIDGNHRAARCLREGRVFRAFVLTEEESETILLRSPTIDDSNSAMGTQLLTEAV